MSARTIDEALGLWKLRLAAAAQNLLDLQSHPVYLRISAPDSNLKGETAAQSALAVGTCGRLMQYCDLLQHTVARAEELRQDMPSIFGADERERAIVAVLQGRSIQMPAVDVPIGQRSLLSNVENITAISPPELLTVMESAFENVKAIVLRLNTAWETLGSSIEQAAQRLAALEPFAESLSAGDRLELNSAAQQLRLLQQSATEDPLGATSQGLASIHQMLDRVNAQVEELRRKREQAHSGLVTARSLLSSLKSEHEAARAMGIEALDKTGLAIDFDATDQKVAGLTEWFDRLSAANNRSTPAALVVGLKNWTQAAQQTLAANRGAMAQARQAIETRMELRGRLEALKAKARAYSFAEHDELVDLADQATALLYRRPTPLDESAALVAAYEAKLNLRVKNVV